MNEEKERKNDNPAYVWHIEQDKVNYIEKIITSYGKPTDVDSSLGSCRVKSAAVYEILKDSDGLIRGIKNMQTGKILV